MVAAVDRDGIRLQQPGQGAGQRHRVAGQMVGRHLVVGHGGVLRRHGGHLGELSEDSLRNLYLSRRENRGGRPVVQMDAHSDPTAQENSGCHWTAHTKVFPGA